jgi:hypothetical protein
MTGDDLVTHVRDLLAVNRYLTLGTVGGDGRPWSSPVYFAADGVADYYWVSATDAVHSRNIAARPHVSVVVFDSTVPAYHGRAVYAAAEARELSGADVERALEVYPGPDDRGGSALTRADVTGGSEWRMYRATASELWVLCPRDRGEVCARHGVGRDHRARVPLG